jgi:hypothetical protein
VGAFRADLRVNAKKLFKSEDEKVMLIEMIQNRRRASIQNGREPGSSLRTVAGPIGDCPTQEEIGSTYQSPRKINRNMTIDGHLQISPNNSRLTRSIIDIKGAG